MLHNICIVIVNEGAFRIRGLKRKLPHFYEMTKILLLRFVIQFQANRHSSRRSSNCSVCSILKFSQLDRDLNWSQMKVVTNKSGHKWKWSQMKVITNEMVTKKIFFELQKY